MVVPMIEERYPSQQLKDLGKHADACLRLVKLKYYFTLTHLPGGKKVWNCYSTMRCDGWDYSKFSSGDSKQEVKENCAFKLLHELCYRHGIFSLAFPGI